MQRRVKFYWICVMFGLGIIFILARLRYKNKNKYLKPLYKSNLHRVKTNPFLDETENSPHSLTNTYLDEKEISPHLIPLNLDGSPNIEQILRDTRLKIKSDLNDYNFTYTSVNKLEDLLIEAGGNPVRSILVSAWRSGSTFVGEMLNAMPSNFYHYEPLLQYQIKQIRGPPHGEKAVNELKSMFRCNYSGMDEYFQYGKAHVMYLNQFKHNTRLWDQCKYKEELCYDAHFTAMYCKLFPFQSMKVVRFRLHLVKDILEDKKLDVKVVLLVRDPRGVLQSRRYRNYCRTAPDCIQPKIVCGDMVRDYVAARQLIRKYPGRVRVLRFEDLALNLNKTIPDLTKFLRLGPTKSLEEFIEMHTNKDFGGVDSTFKITKDVPFKWKNILDFEYVNEIQEACRQAMDLWGYKLAHNATHMTGKSFSSLKTLSAF